MSSTLAILLAVFATPILGAVSITSPVQSTTCKGGSSCKVSWIDDGQAPPLSSYGTTNIGIYVGNRYQQTEVQDLGNFNPASQSSVTFTVDPNSGANSNQYFIRFQSASGTDSSGAPLEAFSAQFTLENMTGTFSPAISAQMAGVTSAGGNQVFTATGGAAATASDVVATVTVTSSSPSSSSHSEDSAAAPSARAFTGFAALAAAVLAYTLA